MANQIDYTTELADSKAVIHINGELDMYCVTGLKRELFQYVEDNEAAINEVYVEMSGLKSIDSTGIAFLANLHMKVR